MRILIVDDSRDFVALLNLYLKREFHGAEISNYDFPKNGRPPPDFDWSGYDILLLDYRLSDTEDGLEWLTLFGQRHDFPPTIILTAEGDEYIAARAIKLGAAEYINKKDISPRRLASLIQDTLSITAEKTAEKKAILEQDSEIINRLRRDEKFEGKRSRSEYKLVRLIGRGAMSHVYLAERGADGLSMVLKVLDISATDRTQLRRFLQEAELIARLNSTFVVKIHEHGVTNKYGFIAMEFFSRGDLKQRLENGIDTDTALSYMTHIAYGLNEIHHAGIIHRDLKPANIMFRGDDSLALADFGISKRLDSRGDLTTIGKVLGTPHYMSPEQGQGLTLDARSDIYSAGILFYELLTGQKPFRADSPAAMIYQHVHTPIPRLPIRLQRYQPLIDQCTAKNPVDRYPSAMALITDLEALEAD